MAFQNPLEIVRDAVGESRDELERVDDLEVFIIAFRGSSEVCELPADLMWSCVACDLDWREVSERMKYSS